MVTLCVVQVRSATRIAYILRCRAAGIRAYTSEPCIIIHISPGLFLPQTKCPSGVPQIIWPKTQGLPKYRQLTPQVHVTSTSLLSRVTHVVDSPSQVRTTSLRGRTLNVHRVDRGFFRTFPGFLFVLDLPLSVPVFLLLPWPICHQTSLHLTRGSPSSTILSRI